MPLWSRLGIASGLRDSWFNLWCHDHQDHLLNHVAATSGQQLRIGLQQGAGGVWCLPCLLHPGQVMLSDIILFLQPKMVFWYLKEIYPNIYRNTYWKPLKNISNQPTCQSSYYLNRLVCYSRTRGAKCTPAAETLSTATLHWTTSTESHGGTNLRRGFLFPQNGEVVYKVSWEISKSKVLKLKKYWRILRIIGTYWHERL